MPIKLRVPCENECGRHVNIIYNPNKICRKCNRKMRYALIKVAAKAKRNT